MNNRVIAADERRLVFRAWANGEMDYGHSMPDLDFWTKNNDRYTIEYMQYTGANDCKGRMVFEGDIVKYFSRFICEEKADKKGRADVEILFTDAYDNKTFERYNALIGVVRWNNEYQCYEPIIIDSEYGYRFSFILSCKPEEKIEEGWAQSWYEVIGNIYEHPKLIPKKNKK